MESGLSLPLTIIEFIFVLGLLIFIHELGHFLAAKFFHIEVDEFGFGYPPKLLKLFKMGNTEITLNWIPFGGFVRIRGESDPSVEGGIGAASPWIRVAVLLAGPIMNLILGILLFSILFVQTGSPDFSTVVIADIADNSPAEEIGLLVDDILYKMNSLSNQF